VDLPFQEYWDVFVFSLPRLMSGTLLTLELVAIAVAVGGLIAIPVALARVSRNPLLWWPAYGYIFFFRGTPLLVQIYLVYYGSGQFRPIFEDIGLWNILRDAYWCAIITLSLNTAAYTAEILRGGIQAVPYGEVEAARAAGMSRYLIYRRIIFPRAYRIALPAYGNEIIFMIKGSALVSFITLFDLMGATRAIFARTFGLEVYVYAAVIYLVLVYGVSKLVKYLEYRLSPDLRPPPDVKLTAVAAGQNGSVAVGR